MPVRPGTAPRGPVTQVGAAAQATLAERLMQEAPESIRVGMLEKPWAKARQLYQDLPKLSSLEEQHDYYRNGGLAEEGKPKGAGDGPLRSVATLCRNLDSNYKDALASFPDWPRTSAFLTHWGNESAYAKQPNSGQGDREQAKIAGGDDGYVQLRTDYMRHLGSLEQALKQVQKTQHETLQVPALTTPPSDGEISPKPLYARNGASPAATLRDGAAPSSFIAGLWTRIQRGVRDIPAAIANLFDRVSAKLRAWTMSAPSHAAAPASTPVPRAPYQAEKQEMKEMTELAGTGEYRKLSEEGFSDIPFIDADDTTLAR
ncbi:hypothetical protein C7R54_18820 [Achromobacter aloeverae]|uniref:Uncharacterized protein n=2 Tax=Achromobacter aloeverae TaxID=1750518 RepID=A0A4V1MRY6_9BURK|nr:hypothetical protein C7R54_18820 [Achromobacter aloeverae]